MNKDPYGDLRATNKQVRLIAINYGQGVKWYEYILPFLLRKRLINYFKGN